MKRAMRLASGVAIAATIRFSMIKRTKQVMGSQMRQARVLAAVRHQAARELAETELRLDYRAGMPLFLFYVGKALKDPDVAPIEVFFDVRQYERIVNNDKVIWGAAIDYVRSELKHAIQES